MSSEKNGLKQLSYDAFISYRHTEPDMFVAKQIHREMEAFRLPRNVKKKMGDNKKARINRVFRDQDELPLASNLEEPIKVALEASDFLIVICSPRLPQSEWCRKEIETFIEMKGREHILAVLIEGEPVNSFPELLCYREEEQQQEDGSIKKVKIAIEPLAADVRGKNQHEVKKKIKEEIIRLAAPMFSCAYDDLKQRHRERKIKRILTLAGLGSAVCLLFGAVSTTMALQIQKQNKEITRQSEQIVAQKDEIQQQYKAAMVTNAELTAESAFSLLNEGDRVEAVRSVREVLPDTKTDGELPYVATAEYALSECLQVYADGSTLLPRLNMKHDSNLSFMIVSPDGDRLLTVDDSAMVTVWDIDSGRELLQIGDYVQQVLLEETEIVFLDNDKIACLSDNLEDFGKIITIINIADDTRQVIETEDAFQIASDSKGGLVTLGYRQASILRNGQFIPVSEETDNFYNVNLAYAFNGDKSLFAYAQVADDEAEHDRVLVIDTTSGEVKHCYQMEYDSFSKLRFEDDVLYVINNKGYDDIKKESGEISLMNMVFGGRILACDLNTFDQTLWQYESRDVALTDVLPLGISDSNILVANGYSNVVYINALDGTGIADYDFEESLAEVSRVKDSQWMYGYTKSGVLYSMRLDGQELLVNALGQSLEYCNGGIKELEFGNGCILLLPNSGVSVTEMVYLQSSQLQVFGSTANTMTYQKLNKQKDKIVYGDYWDTMFYVMDVNSGDILFTIDTQFDYISDSGFVGEQDEAIAVLSSNTIKLFSSEDGTIIKELELENFWNHIFLGGEHGQFIFCAENDQMRVYDTITGELLHEISLQRSLAISDCIAINHYGKLAAASIAADKSLSIYSIEKGSKLADIEINASFVSNLFFYPEEKEDGSARLFVAYKDRSMDVFEVNADGALTLSTSFEPFYSNLDTAIPGPDDTYMLMGANEGYYIQNDQIVARIPAMRIVNWDKMEVITGTGTDLYKFPIYTYDMLLQEADNYLVQH